MYKDHGYKKLNPFFLRGSDQSSGTNDGIFELVLESEQV